MIWILLRDKFPPVIIEVQEKESHYAAIEKADEGDHKPFPLFIGNLLAGQYMMNAPAEDSLEDLLSFSNSNLKTHIRQPFVIECLIFLRLIATGIKWFKGRYCGPQTFH